MSALLWLFNTVIEVYLIFVIASVVLSWLIAFNVANPYNQFVYQIREFLARITEPLLGPIRRILPDLGGIDLSPMVLIIGIIFVQRLVNEAFMSMAYGGMGGMGSF
jgi:YggT family protein